MLAHCSAEHYAKLAPLLWRDGGAQTVNSGFDRVRALCAARGASVSPIAGAQRTRTGISAAVTESATTKARNSCTESPMYSVRLALGQDSLVKFRVQRTSVPRSDGEVANRSGGLTRKRHTNVLRHRRSLQIGNFVDSHPLKQRRSQAQRCVLMGRAAMPPSGFSSAPSLHRMRERTP